MENTAGKTPEEIKESVKHAYSSLWSSETTCCSPTPTRSCGTLKQGYSSLDAAARTRLFEELSPKQGMKILDVGSGLGNTVLAIAEKVKPTGRAVGVDFSESAIAISQEKAEKAGLKGVTEFKLGDAENLPFGDETFDAVISECVVCLVPDKQKALDEKVRVLKPGGRVVMHDVVVHAPMPEAMRSNPALYCGCIGGAVSIYDYKTMMEKAGLQEIRIVDFTGEVEKAMNAIVLSVAANLEKSTLLGQALQFVHKGGLGYALFSGAKRDTG